jgi:hypothetical protein
MVVWNIFFATILLPLVGVALLGRRRRQPFSAWATTLILAAGMAGFGLLVAPWGWFGIPLRIFIAMVFVLSLVLSLRKPIVDVLEPPSPVRMLMMVLIGFFFGNVAIGVLRAHAVPPGTVDVAFPLAHGTYVVGQGGSHPAANIHALEPAQQYAVDLMKLNGAGMRARGIYPDDARAYAIFGEPVISPCDGTIITAADGFPDAARMSLDTKNPAGNHAILRCGDVDVTLAHLQRGSVAVRAGTQVTRGTPLGRVGNSGNSSEPHLQVSAMRNGIAVPLRFDGRWLVRNSIVRK